MSKESIPMNNPSKRKLILSGLIDLIIALFFGILIAFTLYYLILPIFSTSSEYASAYELNCDVVIAKLFGGMPMLVMSLFLAIGFSFLIGLIFSFCYVKSCFVFAKMDLAQAKTKTKIMTFYGLTQVFIALIAIVFAIFVMIKLNNDIYSKTVALTDFCVGIAFSTTGAIKIASAKSIKHTNIVYKNTNPSLQALPSYYYYY